MRIFDIGNKARVGFWCAAPDEDTAKRIALAAGHAKRLENLRAKDVTDRFLDPDMYDPAQHHGIRDIVDGDVTGRVFAEFRSYRMDEIMDSIVRTGNAPPRHPTVWKVRPLTVEASA